MGGLETIQRILDAVESQAVEDFKLELADAENWIFIPVHEDGKEGATAIIMNIETSFGQLNLEFPINAFQRIIRGEG